MNDFTLLIDLHKDAERQGPGGRVQTEPALTLSGLAKRSGMKIADIGCGTGASTLVLGRNLDAQITAIDFLPDFLDILEKKAAASGLARRIETLSVSMDELPFADASLDAIWAEGAIYNIGFEHGIRSWRRFLKPGGVLAVSELTWLTSKRHEELQQHWDSEYPEVATASRKIAQLEDGGYNPIGYFSLPPECWLANYYRPMQARFSQFLKRHGNSEEAREIVEAEKTEIDLYERFSDFVSYGFYIARKLP